MMLCLAVMMIPLPNASHESSTLCSIQRKNNISQLYVDHKVVKAVLTQFKTAP